ncbi:DUF7680 family protein [Natrinema salifodinae]|uniref:DUF7680 domain-containing protein n=1 Tax=Natrinema salifodinae TaxID=1202768 RepID=A0A1I0N150_9EURY|nr:hypothetical protein [Natrinema salifodinae]SEV94639.1 hypothetical protein SAMN05216285_1219 [Natrinema salifodinae]
MSIESEAESFAYGSSIHGGRPTFALTRRLGDDAGLTLYEFIPEDLANGRQKRLRRANSNHTLSRLSIPKALPDVTEDSVGRLDFTDIGSPKERTPNNWNWDEWCALKVTTLREKHQQAVHRLIKSVLDDAGIDPAIVTRGEGSVVLSESDGVRLTIAFLALKELQKYEKLTTVVDSIARMSSEECYYWHAKCRSPTNPNGVRALRELLAGHI